MDEALKSIWLSQVLDHGVPPVRRNAALRAFAWVCDVHSLDSPYANDLKVTKGLLVKGHSLSMAFRDALFEAAKDEVIGWTAAKAIGEIAAVDGVLTKKNHAIVKVRFAIVL